MRQDVSIEVRCQYFGHELDNVNVQSYTKKFTIEEMQAKVKAVQISILEGSGLI